MSTKVPSTLFELMTRQVRDYAIFLLDTDGRITSWNVGARRIKQYEADEIIGKHFSIFYTAPDIQRGWPAFELERALVDGRFEDEGWRVRKDGSRFWANVIITALRDDDGMLLAYSKITRDLTERKTQEEQLRQSEERFRLLVEGVQDYAIYMLSPDGVVTSWNLGARRIKGYEASEIIGQHFSRFYLPEDIAAGKPWAELAAARQTGHVVDEGWRQRRDGTKFWARVMVTALHDADGRLRGFGKVTQDLTERRQLETLATSAGNLNNFIAVLAHELRNPLAPIRHAVELQRLAAPDDPIQESSRQVIDRQSRHLGRLVDDLLDVSRLTRGSLPLDMRHCELAFIVERAVETARPAIDAAGHSLHLDLTPARVALAGDELRLIQALTNILNNAARYTDPGGRIFLATSVTQSPDCANAVISVRDTGRGIDPQMKGSIFGMFIQGKDPLKRVPSGLGVGLAIARSIVELHHGTIEVHSDGPGKGSTFVITLPTTDRGSVPLDHAAEFARCAPDRASPCHRVLVVDDNDDARTMLASLLARWGHVVRSAPNGIEALELFEEFRPTIVLLDLGMPGMNGLEVARRIRQRKPSPHPLLVAVTGWVKADDRSRAFEAGVDRHLTKPVGEAELLEVLGAQTTPVH